MFAIDPERGLYGANYPWEPREHLEVPAYLEQGDIVFLESQAAA